MVVPDSIIIALILGATCLEDKKDKTKKTNNRESVLSHTNIKLFSLYELSWLMSLYLVQPLPSFLTIRHATQAWRKVPEADISVLRLWERTQETMFMRGDQIIQSAISAYMELNHLTALTCLHQVPEVKNVTKVSRRVIFGSVLVQWTV